MVVTWRTEEDDGREDKGGEDTQEGLLSKLGDVVDERSVAAVRELTIEERAIESERGDKGGRAVAAKRRDKVEKRLRGPADGSG